MADFMQLNPSGAYRVGVNDDHILAFPFRFAGRLIDENIHRLLLPGVLGGIRFDGRLPFYSFNAVSLVGEWITALQTWERNERVLHMIPSLGVIDGREPLRQNITYLQNLQNGAPDAGDYNGMVGPNGSGKTMLWHTILKTLKTLSGKVNISDLWFLDVYSVSPNSPSCEYNILKNNSLRFILSLRLGGIVWLWKKSESTTF